MILSQSIYMAPEAAKRTLTSGRLWIIPHSPAEAPTPVMYFPVHKLRLGALPQRFEIVLAPGYKRRNIPTYRLATTRLHTCGPPTKG